MKVPRLSGVICWVYHCAISPQRRRPLANKILLLTIFRYADSHKLQRSSANPQFLKFGICLPADLSAVALAKAGASAQAESLFEV